MTSETPENPSNHARPAAEAEPRGQPRRGPRAAGQPRGDPAGGRRAGAGRGAGPGARAPAERGEAELRDLAASYVAEGRGFDLREIAGGWRFYTREDCAPLVERFVSDGQEVRLTQAALETLAVVAYRQPVSRARVSAVRGVNCDGVMRTLVLRGLTEEAGTDKETGAILYRTTGYFLERLGLASLEDLPDLAPFLPENIEDIEDENARS